MNSNWTLCVPLPLLLYFIIIIIIIMVFYYYYRRMMIMVKGLRSTLSRKGIVYNNH